MADSSSTSFNNTHLQDPIPTKPPKSKFPFTHYFFSKSLIIILVLLVFSFFPSQVPEIFKKTTIVTMLWELFYLLIIGIAVCYGLFSRKMERVHSSDELAHSDAKETYLSGISHISSIFEDGIQTSYGFDEKGLFEGSGSRLSEFGNGLGKSDEKKLNQYFLGESMVVINDENYVLEQLSKPKTIKQNKPLCLPVRSLGSKSLDSAAGKSSNGDGCNSVVKDSSNGGNGNGNGNGNRNGIRNRKFRGLVPIKLEEKFKETDSDSGSGSPTPLNWRSKSMRLEKRGDLFTTEANESSDSRPLSVGDLDFEGLRSKSMRFSMPTQIKNSSEKQESKGIETNHVYRQPYLNNETSFIESKPREFSIGTSSEKNTHLSSKKILKHFGNRGSSEEILKDSGNHGSSEDILKGFSIHGSYKEILKDCGNHGSYKGTVKDYGNHGSSKEILKDFGKIKVEGDTLDSNNKSSFFESNKQQSSIGSSSETNMGTYEYALGKEEKSDSSNSSPKAVIIANTYKRGKSVRTNRPKEQVAEAKVKIFPNQTEDKAEKGSKQGSDVNLDDIEPHSGEVDRKAEEFIAKFREQIRLQQVASARRLNL
ncbi:uncharacterized protein LOC112502599 [Cynara cardunculus var. scolymus]|uniref:uncharacterized protein LOC112502599 n=1 Tax=Cynara cardunculus var. scolymus TaxID=59895 RepID=UPI000D626EA2|nr:uncharacterized protein LOC112502599 [Cynara cardunculus var. scolymus]